MAVYNSLVSRDVSDDPLIPEPVSAQIIEEMPASSFLLQHAGQVRMSTKTQRQPVLDVLPTAYWVSGDSGMKQTSAVDWTIVLGDSNPPAALPSAPTLNRALISNPK